MTPHEKELRNEVRKEARRIKKNATPSELKFLNFKDLDPNSQLSCIYGQMTGSCNSDRAIELIKACAKKTYTGKLNLYDKTIKALPRLNGPIKKSRRNLGFFSSFTSHSPIEYFILKSVSDNKKINNKILIDFLKGKSTTMKFK